MKSFSLDLDNTTAANYRLIKVMNYLHIIILQKLELIGIKVTALDWFETVLNLTDSGSYMHMN